MVGTVLSILGGWPGPPAWRRLHRATRNDVLELARQGKLHPDEKIAAIAVEWARWRSALSGWRQVGIAIATILAIQAAMGLLFLLLTLVPGGETTYDGSLLGWVQVIGALALAFGRLVMVPSSAAYEILRLHTLAAEQDEGEGTAMTRQPSWPGPSAQEHRREVVAGS